MEILDIHSHLKSDLITDPNCGYQIFEYLTQRHIRDIPKLNFEIIYMELPKPCPVDGLQYEIHRYNSKMYQEYLNQCICTLKGSTILTTSPNISIIYGTLATHLHVFIAGLKEDRIIYPFTDKGQKIVGDKKCRKQIKRIFHTHRQTTGGRLNIKMLSYQYKHPHVEDKTVSRPSYV